MLFVVPVYVKWSDVIIQYMLYVLRTYVAVMRDARQERTLKYKAMMINAIPFFLLKRTTMVGNVEKILIE